jgi:XRE family transcriptional regulator, regulator of sulfur utilization
MTRSYDEVSAELQGELSEAGKQALSVFEGAYRLAVQIVDQREELKLTQMELAEKSGVNQADISRIERGSAYPNERTLIKLAQALGARWELVAQPATEASIPAATARSRTVTKGTPRPQRMRARTTKTVSELPTVRRQKVG